ncbi:Mg2+ transporter like zinc transport [Fusarium pseudoanthophilum]|uniref:Mg2+ transporter like zinc transport n=1 Tax=Fusarium pseudoanthophilum TaxID=48495 RepID=A0A8H5Q4N0_9HYPO|nr:Mg2+ transporter like zinc transport [Fusarium pseudoanthophilum]
MVRNLPQSPFQRRNLVDKVSSSCSIRSELSGAIHGCMNKATKAPATLLVFSFDFSPERRNVRIKSVHITVEFYGNDGHPVISAMVPDGRVTALENTTEQTSGSRGGLRFGERIPAVNALGFDFEQAFTAAVQTSSSVLLTGYKSPKGKVEGGSNVVNWTIMEDLVVKAGVPAYLQTAILLERKTDEIFKADFKIKADVSGFSFRNLQDGLLESEDDPVIFDPGASPLIPDGLEGLDLNELGSVGLAQFCTMENTTFFDDIPRRRTIGQAVKDLFSEERTEKVKPAEYTVESWFVDLWDNGQAEDAQPRLYGPLGRDDLEEHFAWSSETPNVDVPAPDSQGIREAQESRKANFCNLLAMQSSVSKLTTFTKLKGLFDKLPLKLLSDFFDLPDDFPISRQHDRGGCQVFDNEEGEKAFKLYIIQTPFYSKGFWSLLLYTMTNRDVAGASTKLSGVIQVDKDVNLTNIFRDVRDLVARVSKVDDDLLRHLQDEDKLDDASKLYRSLSMTLHECSMDLAELGRRRKFEKELGSVLQKDLSHDSKLRVLVEIYSRMSQSRDSDIESLPGKIESQRNVLYNLITQHDSYLQARLARESLRDSKAMKTLSILTILFLPGAFIATMFSTNMFDFKSKNQQVRIYFAIVIPLTAFLMICWVLWLKNTPERADEESVGQNQPAAAMSWLKGIKAD